ncbi:alpha/beta hydrolase [Streptomyces nanshensis]|uniref:alpha/beta hydrolase n=1 Tax=Streptomyces nanshensis TaxID=518642 RepID=UPI001C0BBC7A
MHSAVHSAAHPAVHPAVDSTVRDPSAVVLVLHGGRSEGLAAPPSWNLPDLRMRPFLRSLVRATADGRVLVCRLGYRCRGWNGVRADAARDAEWALGELRRTVGELPMVLVGHSMGGRAALRVGGDRCVRGVVALAPWCPPGEETAQLSGRRVVILHGDRDRVTDPAASREFAFRARRDGADARFVTVPGGDHAMLRRAAEWQRAVDREVAAMLTAASAHTPGGRPAPDPPSGSATRPPSPSSPPNEPFPPGD